MTLEQYFKDTVNKVLNVIDINVNIKMFDHGKLEGKHKKAIGCCHKFSDNSYLITIDDYFVQECYEHFILKAKYSSWGLVGETLEQCICHELAHLTEWRHGRKHKELTNKYLDQCK